MTPGPDVRGAVEQAILLSIGAASITRDRVEEVVTELVRQGRISGEEGRAVVERVVSRAVGEGRVPSGLVGSLESGLRGAFREAGLMTRGDLDDVRVQLAELDHRVRLLEGSPPAPPTARPDASAAGDPPA
jgi:polyhydroxyalkanoate synthesis regulator phasin